MNCQKCGSDQLKVNEKRDLPGENSVRRRRECQNCGFRFTTYERIEIPLLLVQKKTCHTEPYLREKLASGFFKALEKRPFSHSQIEHLVDEVERAIMSIHREEIKASEIGELVIGKLKEVDEVAYLRFVSVYKSFENASSFAKELEELKK